MALAKGQSLASLRKDKELSEPVSAPGGTEAPSAVSGGGLVLVWVWVWVWFWFGFGLVWFWFGLVGLGLVWFGLVYPPTMTS